MVNSKNILLRKTWIGLAITIAFIAATVVLVSFPASRFTDPAAREYAAGIARVILGLIVIVTIRQRNWGSNTLSSPSSRSWAIILPVAVYCLVVYPLLFTGTLSLNLSQPNLAAGVAFNGFAAGALEELVFRGLILSLLLSGNSDDHNPTNIWRAIIISAVLFSVPHALNVFAGHAEAGKGKGEPTDKDPIQHYDDQDRGEGGQGCGGKTVSVRRAGWGLIIPAYACQSDQLYERLQSKEVREMKMVQDPFYLFFISFPGWGGLIEK